MAQRGGITQAEKARFEASFRRFAASVIERALPRAVERTANFAAGEIRDGARERTGETKRSVAVEQQGLTAQVSVGGAAVFQEFGTRPHVIRPRTATVLRFEINGETVFAKKVNHPGTPKAPFVRPAADAARPVFVLATQEAVRAAALLHR